MSTEQKKATTAEERKAAWEHNRYIDASIARINEKLVENFAEYLFKIGISQASQHLKDFRKEVRTKILTEQVQRKMGFGRYADETVWDVYCTARGRQYLDWYIKNEDARDDIKNAYEMCAACATEKLCVPPEAKSVCDLTTAEEGLTTQKKKRVPTKKKRRKVEASNEEACKKTKVH